MMAFELNQHFLQIKTFTGKKNGPLFVINEANIFKSTTKFV